MPEDPVRSNLPERTGVIVSLSWLLLMAAVIVWLVVRSGRLLALW
jgi:hypothetical protein